MPRKIKIGLLALGTVLGYGFGFAHMAGGCHNSRRAAFEQHVAKVCVDAAKQAKPEAPPAP